MDPCVAAPTDPASLLFTEAERWANVERNDAEFRQGAATLASRPRFVTVGAHNSCNAKCVFCLEGKYERFSLEMYKDFFEPAMGRYIRSAEKVTFTGFGEVLWIPGVERFLEYINATIPETEKIFTTNGTPLTPPVVDLLLKSRYVIQISLHASNAALHEKLTLLKDEHAKIIANVERLSAERRTRKLHGRLHIVLVNVITNDNIDDLPDFLRMAWRMGIPEVVCNYVTMYNADHIRMSCFFEQERANRAIAKAKEVLAEIGASAAPEEFRHFRVRLPTPFGLTPDAPAAAEKCPEPWQHVYVEGQGSVLPCCNWGAHIGNLRNGDTLDGVWNGAFYRDLRTRMASAEPHPWCSVCVRYRGYNVDNLLCHLTNRPNQQRTLLHAIRERGLADIAGYLEWVDAAEKHVPIG